MESFIDISIFGPLKHQFDPEAKLSEETIINVPYKSGETLKALLKRLNVSESDCGEFFINHTIATNRKEVIPLNARVAIFSCGMFLIDGGLYIKKWND
jgi:hypothetical protein